MKQLIVFMSLFFLLGCKNKLNDFEFVYDLTSKTGQELGKIYVNKLNDTLFNKLKIVKNRKVIYSIDKHTLSNEKGIDIIVRKNDFYGWTFSLKNKDYFILNLYHDNGKSVGDNVQIIWNYEKEIFEVLKTP